MIRMGSATWEKVLRNLRGTGDRSELLTIIYGAIVPREVWRAENSGSRTRSNIVDRTVVRGDDFTCEVEQLEVVAQSGMLVRNRKVKIDNRVALTGTRNAEGIARSKKIWGNAANIDSAAANIGIYRVEKAIGVSRSIRIIAIAIHLIRAGKTDVIAKQARRSRAAGLKRKAMKKCRCAD